MNSIKNICIESVYYVKSVSNDNLPLEPLVIRPTIDQVRHRILWEDTDKDRAFVFHTINSDDFKNYEEKKVTPQTIRFTIESGIYKGIEIEFALLTLEVFNRQIRHLISDAQEFKSEEELKEYFLNTNFSG